MSQNLQSAAVVIGTLRVKAGANFENVFDDAFTVKVSRESIHVISFVTQL